MTFDILHYALLTAERAVKIMKQKQKNKEEDDMMAALEGTSLDGEVAPDSANGNKYAGDNRNVREVPHARTSRAFPTSAPTDMQTTQYSFVQSEPRSGCFKKSPFSFDRKDPRTEEIIFIHTRIFRTVFTCPHLSVFCCNSIAIDAFSPTLPH